LFELIVGLGNVGEKYLNNRHNCGFQVIDHLVNYLNLTLNKDELDLDIGVVKLKRSGGHAGHNGIRDCITNLGNEFCRLRVGIGRPEFQTVADYVLSDHTNDEYMSLKKVFEFTVSKFDDFFNFEFEDLQKVFNGYKLKL
jgi:peptidyl-tRNA hydrolase